MDNRKHKPYQRGMISPAGIVWGVSGASYIYAILNGSALYVGETGDLPPKRWGQHLSSGGTYSEKADNAGIILSGPIDTVFIAVRCHDIDNENAQYRKLARRAVEEEVHRQFLLDSRPFGDDFRLLSLAPSPPIRFRWSFDTVSVAKDIYAHVVSEYSFWKQRQ
jgi:hypothetical protein